MGSPLKLFENNEEELDEEIKIDQEFAKRYEHNKTREDLQRYEELKKRGLAVSSDSDSDESSSEDDELMKQNKKKDAKFFDALNRLKRQDPVDKDVKLFDSDTERDSDSGNPGKGEEKRKKPVYLKDVVSKQLIEEGPEFDDEETDDHGEKEKGVKSYAEEQEELRRQFFEADAQVGNDEDEGGLFSVKNGGSKDMEDVEDQDDDEFRDKLDAFFGKDDNLDADSMFLKSYFRDRMWCDDGKGLENFNLSEEEEEIEKQEDYEREYNFRYEENAGDRVWGHSRKIEDSVRKKDNARKSKREKKEERLAQVELERKEELKRLKNLKKKEIEEKLEKIREVAGIDKNKAVPVLDEDDLEEEFDPEKHDRMMKQAFDDGYYNAEDADMGFGSDGDEDGLAKPNFGEEDELFGLPKNWDEVESTGQGFTSAREKVLNNSVVDETVEEAEGSQGKRKRKRKPSEIEKAVREQLMEEYYKLDYEDTIGDLKTRFKYKPVTAKRYGLTPEMVLMMDDKDLNQYVSLKKLAPYQEKEWKVPRIQTLQLKKLLTDEGKKKAQKDMKKATLVEDIAASEPTERKSDTGSISKKSMRKRRQADLKLSRSRLMAYGKIPTKAKSKK